MWSSGARNLPPTPFGRPSRLVPKAPEFGMPPPPDLSVLPHGTDGRLLLEHASSTIFFRSLVTRDTVTQTDIELFARRAIATATIEL